MCDVFRLLPYSGSGICSDYSTPFEIFPDITSQDNWQTNWALPTVLKWNPASYYDEKFVAALGTGSSCRAFYDKTDVTPGDCLGEIITIYR